MTQHADLYPLTQNGSHPQPPRTSASSSKVYFWLGLLWLAALVVQQSIGWRWPLLTEWQGDSVYKQATGFALLAFILYQWRFSLKRAQGQVRNGLALLRRHKLFGAFAPLLFFLHSQALGYGYLELLSLVFLLVFLTGLCNIEIIALRKRWYRPVWIGLHVSASMALLFLLTYHVYLSYAFK